MNLWVITDVLHEHSRYTRPKWYKTNMEAFHKTYSIYILVCLFLFATFVLFCLVRIQPILHNTWWPGCDVNQYIRNNWVIMSSISSVPMNARCHQIRMFWIPYLNNDTVQNVNEPTAITRNWFMITSCDATPFHITGPLWEVIHVAVTHTKGQWHETSMFSLMIAWTICWTVDILVIWDATLFMWRHCTVLTYLRHG